MQLVLFRFYHQVLSVFWIEHQARKQMRFLQLQNSLSLSDSVVWVSEGGNRENAIGLLKVGTRRCRAVVLSRLLRQEQI